ncbi:MAG TPA: phospholipase D-like domain-containing protein [Burkholderiaceae bacterium]|nr:phospholipase D-like domain-containing protein [Burkholderiaceae bacterium]
MLLTLAAACSSTLPVREAAHTAAPERSRVTVHGAAGPVSPAQEARALDALAAEGANDLMRNHLQVLTAGGEVDLYRGNQARLLIDGPATFGAMKAAIGNARRRVMLESYIVEDQGVAAEIAALLLRKAAQGVRVTMIYDAVGSIATPDAFFKRLNDGGVATCAFNPVNPTKRPGNWGINHRDHRKLLVVDDQVAFTGGINISRVYGSGSFSRRKAPPRDDALEDGWRDTQIEIRGPAVAAMVDLYTATWRDQGCKGELGPAAPPSATREPGERIVKLLASDPRDEVNRIYTTLLGAVEASRRSVFLTMAYFAPGEDFVAALCRAAKRGVKVELVLPGRSDFALILHAGRSYYAQMLECGIKLYEMERAVMHSKTAVIDGVFSTVGSSNLDWRSLVSNNEVNAIVLGEDFGAQLEALFVKDRSASVAIEADQWRRRGLRQRALELMGRAAERWL